MGAAVASTGGGARRQTEGRGGGLTHVNVKQHNEVLERSSKPFGLGEKGGKKNCGILSRLFRLLEL